jgi:ABC-type polysaccharide transport system permease subunit
MGCRCLEWFGFFVTLFGKAPPLVIMIVMRIKEMLSIGYERVLLLCNVNVNIPEDVLSMRISCLSMAVFPTVVTAMPALAKEL